MRSQKKKKKLNGPVLTTNVDGQILRANTPYIYLNVDGQIFRANTPYIYLNVDGDPARQLRGHREEAIQGLAHQPVCVPRAAHFNPSSSARGVRGRPCDLLVCSKFVSLE